MKICPTCGVSKSLTEFYTRQGKADNTYHSRNCKPCEIKRASERGSKKEKRRRRWINYIKRHRGCSRCGFDNPIALDFHHPDDNKEAGVHALLTSRLDRLFDEIRKCEVICANCHRIEHHSIRVK